MRHKQNVVLYLDRRVVEKSRELGFNLSKTCENHLKQLITHFQHVNEGNNDRNDDKDCGWWGCPDLNRGHESPSLNKPFNIEETLASFEEFCSTDLQLSKGTVKLHKRLVEKFIHFIAKNPRDVSKEELRNYLSSVREGVAGSTYKNILAALKRFYRDFLGMKDIVESFRFPHRTFKPKIIPSHEELRKFYNALKSQRDKALFLVYASSGLRNNEVLSLNRFTDIDYEKRMIIPKKEGNASKHVWVSFYNEEADRELKKYLASRKDDDPRLFPICSAHVLRIFRKTRRRCGVNVTPQILREWFCSKMGELGVQDRYVDAFCGRVPNSVLARHYTDYAPDKLKRIYDKTRITVLN